MKGSRLNLGIRSLFALFVLLAMLCAPVLADYDAALAGIPHHQQMMERDGHCQMPPVGASGHDKAEGKSCCISVSMAATVEPAQPLFEGCSDRAIPTFPVPPFHLGQLTEIATPPPRHV